jgi:hypothetical protein
MSTATVSLVLVGLLAVAMAPRRAGDVAGPGGSQGPTTSLFALVTTTVRAAEPPTATTGLPATAVRPSSATQPAAATATTVVATFTTAATVAVEVVVTPLGSGMGVTTRSAAGGGSGMIDAVVPSGDAVVADVLYSASNLAFVVIVRGDVEHSMAVGAPVGDGELYLAYGDAMTVVDAASLASADVPEGTPIVNADGMVVGLCTRGPDGLEMVPIGAAPPTAPDSVVSVAEPVATAAAPVETSAASTIGLPADSTVDPRVDSGIDSGEVTSSLSSVTLPGSVASVATPPG